MTETFKRDLAEWLKEQGVKEVIISDTTIEFAGDDGRWLMNNRDFADEGL